MRHESGREMPEPSGAESLHMDYDTVTCAWCGARVPEPNAVESGRRWFCDTECAEQYTENELAARADAAHDNAREP